MNVTDISAHVQSIIAPVKHSMARHIKKRFPIAIIKWNDSWQLCDKGIISITGDAFYIDIETIEWVRFLRELKEQVVPSDVHISVFPHTTEDTIEYYQSVQ